MPLEIRSREVVRPTTHRYVGRYSSVKNQRMVHWESKLERDQIVLLEIDPEVLAYAEQPTPFFYEIDGKQHKYTPDFLVHSRRGSFVVEVKAAKFAERPDWREHLEFLQELVEENGLRYVVATEQSIRREPRLRNANRILRYRGCSFDDTLKREILTAIQNDHALSITRLETKLGIDDLYAETCVLIAAGLLSVDLNKPFDRNAPVFSYEEAVI